MTKSKAEELQEMREKLAKEAKQNNENTLLEKSLEQLNIGNKIDINQIDEKLSTSEIVNEFKKEAKYEVSK